AELQRLEFGYAGLEGNEASVAPGGWLEFTRLETGLWFVNRWALRVPALGEWIERSARQTLLIGMRHVQVVRVNGEVLDLAVDSRALYTAGASAYLKAGELIPIAIPVDSTQPSCLRSSNQALVFGRVFSSTGAVLPAAELRFLWRADGGAVSGWRQI